MSSNGNNVYGPSYLSSRAVQTVPVLLANGNDYIKSLHLYGRNNAIGSIRTSHYVDTMFYSYYRWQNVKPAFSCLTLIDIFRDMLFHRRRLS